MKQLICLSFLEQFICSQFSLQCRHVQGTQALLGVPLGSFVVSKRVTICPTFKRNLHRIIKKEKHVYNSCLRQGWPFTYMHLHIHHCPGEPLPMPHHSLGEESFPKIPHEPTLEQPVAISSCLSPAAWEKNPIPPFQNLPIQPFLQDRVMRWAASTKPWVCSAALSAVLPEESNTIWHQEVTSPELCWAAMPPFQHGWDCGNILHRPAAKLNSCCGATNSGWILLPVKALPRT